MANSLIGESTPHSRLALLAIEYLGDIHLEQGQTDAALRYYDEAWPRAYALVPKGDIVAELRRRRAECYLLLGRFDEARDEALGALKHCRELGDRYEEAATYRILALTMAALGMPSEAKSWFDVGFATYEDIETPYEWGKLWLAYGDWLRGPHAGRFADSGAALEAYRAAREHFERMGESYDYVNVIEESGEGAALMDCWKNADTVILIDAVSSGAKPGTIHRIDAHAEPIPTKYFHCSTHAFGVAEAIELARSLNQLPLCVTIYGIEGKCFEAGVGLISTS